MIHVAVVVGPRWAECAGLTVGAVDFLRGELSVVRQLDPKGGLVAPKSKAGTRRLSVPAWLMQELSEVLAPGGIGAADSDALVFVSPEGRPLRYSTWRRRVWLPATEAAGLAGLRVHDLRSNNATAPVAEGVDVKVAQHRLGHYRSACAVGRLCPSHDGGGPPRCGPGG
jgi:integrase